VRRATAASTSFVALLVACAAVPAAAGADALSSARAAIGLPRTSNGMQARYDAGRALEDVLYARRSGCASHLQLAQGLVRWAEGYDRPVRSLELAGRAEAMRGSSAACARTRLTPARPRLPSVPLLVKAAPPGTPDERPDARLSALGRSFPGYAAIWVHDLVRGTVASWNADARFPAASTVKLGVLLAALKRLRHPERSPLDYELRAMIGWSSNLATNRLVARFGAGAVEAALRRAGATRSTFPQGYRVGTSLAEVQDQPPLVSGRVTTARDLGRVLYVLHACALGNVPALRATGLDRARCSYGLQLLLSSELRGNNVGLVRPFVPESIRVAQKNGWLHDARHTAAIVYSPTGPKIIVILTYARGLTLAAARRVGLLAVSAKN
jgi:beta-lactamase class A